jgi:hypothetical protein
MAVPTGSLTTLTNVKTELSISSSSDDSYLERLIGAATGLISSYTKRTFHYGTAITEYVHGFGTPHLKVSRTPIVSITSITYDGSTIDSDDYEVRGSDANAGIIYKPSCWVWSTNAGPGITHLPTPGAERSPTSGG